MRNGDDVNMRVARQLEHSPCAETDSERCETRLRSLCLALPETEERKTFGGPTFRVRAKIFSLATCRHGRPSVWVKTYPGSQAVLIAADGGRFFVPPYLGPKGWVGIRFDSAPDWTEIELLVRRSYRLVAPKRLAAGV